jgi:hypothetical protein
MQDVQRALRFCSSIGNRCTIASRQHAHAMLKSFPKASAQPQSSLHDLVLATILELQPMNTIEVHDDRPMNTNKLFVPQFALEF